MAKDISDLKVQQRIFFNKLTGILTSPQNIIPIFGGN